MVDTRKVGEQVYLIDDGLYSIPGLGSVYLLTEGKKALIDTGPATSAQTVLEGIQQIGFKSKEVDYIIITHIHLDHSGGAGTLLKYMPRAKVLAHHKAIKHLIDPTRLISSAIEAQGTATMDRNGEVLPIEESKLVPVHDGDVLKLSDKQVLTLLEAPGHAPHELCILESRNRGIFVGDAVGHFVEGTDVMIPITPPPSFEMELFLRTLDRLMKLKAARIYFAHAGYSDQVQEKLEAAAAKLRQRNVVIANAISEKQIDKAAQKLVDHICAEIQFLKKNWRPLYDYWASVDIPMSAAEHLRYYRKKHGV
jgi:glyoxylase-like metal-dependent hydrolase (beta-lactamase superfamily II)